MFFRVNLIVEMASGFYSHRSPSQNSFADNIVYNESASNSPKAPTKSNNCPALTFYALTLGSVSAPASSISVGRYINKNL